MAFWVEFLFFVEAESSLQFFFDVVFPRSFLRCLGKGNFSDFYGLFGPCGFGFVSACLQSPVPFGDTGCWPIGSSWKNVLFETLGGKLLTLVLRLFLVISGFLDYNCSPADCHSGSFKVDARSHPQTPPKTCIISVHFFFVTFQISKQITVGFWDSGIFCPQICKQILGQKIP